MCCAYFCRIGNFLQLHSLLQIPLWKIRRVKAAPYNGANSLHRHGVTGGHAHTEHVPLAPSLAGAEIIKKKKKKVPKESYFKSSASCVWLLVGQGCIIPWNQCGRRQEFLHDWKAWDGGNSPRDLRMDLVGRAPLGHHSLPLPAQALICSAGSHPNNICVASNLSFWNCCGSRGIF